MPELDEHGRPQPPPVGDEASTLLGYVEFLRATLRLKCAGLDAAGLRATHPPSTMTLGGMLKHLAFVEDYWCSYTLHARPPHPPWDTVDWDADPDWDWRSAAGDSPAELWTMWEGAVARSNAAVADALAGGGADQLARRARRDEGAPTLRYILAHLVEEYGRHCGHADLLRESIDGVTGE